MRDRFPVYPTRARSTCHTCPGPGDTPLDVPGRFEAAATPSCCALGDAHRGSKFAQARANCPASGAESAPCISESRSEASATPTGDPRITLYTYQAGLSSRRPVVLCPGRCTQRVESCPKKSQLPRSWCEIDAPCLPVLRPEVSAQPTRALGTALQTYQAGFKQPPHRRLCPWQYTESRKLTK